MLKLLKENGLAALTIIQYTQFLYSGIFFGLVNSLAPIFSYHYGAQNHSYLQKLFRYSIWLLCLFTTLLIGVSLLIPRQLLNLFVESDSEVYSLALYGYLIYIWNFLFAGTNIFASSLFSALSNGKISAIISFLRTFVFIVLSLILLPSLWGVSGIWLSIPIAEGLTFCIAIPLLYFYGKRVYSYIS